MSGTRARLRATPIEAADEIEVAAWIAALTDGPPIDKYLVELPEYHAMRQTLIEFVEHTRMLPNTPGTRETYEELAAAYCNYPGASSERPRKFASVLRWALGKTNETPDLSTFFDRYSHALDRVDRAKS